LDLSRARIGCQGFLDRIRDVADRLNFDWLDARLDSDHLRVK